MESFVVKDLTFTYPNQNKPALVDISLSFTQGEFITICGKSGCGKSTLLKHLKSCFTPAGERRGEIYFEEQSLDQLDQRRQSEKIGFVLQDPDNQIVTDKVWHELAFGLESLGYSNQEIRARVAEMASFFGIQNWFHKKTVELSGGQKQLLNLAAIMVMQPSVLILDEPTSQLDPIAAQDFLETISKVNRELGTTIILSEHRLEEAFPLSDRVIVMDEGHILVQGTPIEVGEKLKNIEHEMFIALPTPMRIYAQVPNTLTCPVTVREGRKWLEEIARERGIQLEKCSNIVEKQPVNKEDHKEKLPLIEVKEAWFRYDEKETDVLKNLSMKIYEGEWLSIVGGNGTGKTTTLSIISGIYRPYRGNVFYQGKKIREVEAGYKAILGILPQNPKALFVNKTVLQELEEMLFTQKLSSEGKETRLKEVIQICELESVLHQHPYDLSGGQMQRAALAKVLLKKPKILLLDEPTKGLDAHYKQKLASVLRRLREEMGLTIIMVSHDIEFCAQYASRCAMFFDGNIVSEGKPRVFFSGKSYYTTAANRMARDKIPSAVIAKDVIEACGGQCVTVSEEQNEKHQLTDEVITHKPQKPIQISGVKLSNTVLKSKVNWLAVVMIFIVMPLTIYGGIAFLGDRKYYFVSLLIIVETFIPFAWRMEHKKLQARELMLISVLCAIGVAGRVAFYMIPAVKPLIAIIIVSAVCLGSETGFMIGAISAFASNIFFGQGPWTPWQMFAFGVIGFLAGLLKGKKGFTTRRLPLCLVGGALTFFIYGGIMNPASVIMYEPRPTLEMFISAYILGAPFDLIHALSTAAFLALISQPMIDKIQRVKEKYDLLETTE